MFDSRRKWSMFTTVVETSSSDECTYWLVSDMMSSDIGQWWCHSYWYWCESWKCHGMSVSLQRPCLVFCCCCFFFFIEKLWNHYCCLKAPILMISVWRDQYQDLLVCEWWYWLTQSNAVLTNKYQQKWHHSWPISLFNGLHVIHN